MLYSREDILALKGGHPNIHARTIPDASANDAGVSVAALRPLPAGPGAIARREDPMLALAGHLARLSAIYAPPAPPKPCLGLREAAEYSGLPAAFLRRSAREGAAFSKNVGSDARPIYRYSSELLKGAR